jgi:hypothetical protein
LNYAEALNPTVRLRYQMHAYGAVALMDASDEM